MAREFIGFDDSYRQPPEDIERLLRSHFPDCFLEWTPRIKRWAVKRRVGWDEVDRLVSEKKITEGDIFAHFQDRFQHGHQDAGSHFVVHAFTVQDPATGEPIEPGGWLIEALQKADTFSNRAYPGGIKAAIKDVLTKRRAEEDAKDAQYTNAIEAAVEDRDYLFRQLPRMAYPENIGGSDGNDGGNQDGSTGTEASAGSADQRGDCGP